MYDKNDIRSTMTAAAPAAKPIKELYEAQYGRFYQDPPVEDDANGKTWYTRGQNFVIVYSDAEPGATFERSGQIDEYMVLLPDHDTPVTASAGGQMETSDGYAVIIMPPGDSKLEFPKGGRVVRIFSTQSADINAKAPNNAAYAEAAKNIPDFQPWPAPPSGYKVRVYTLDVPPEPGRFGRIYRCTTIMLNLPPIGIGPRDLTKVSPHHHDDFEQCSLVLHGTYQHHLRWPWSIDLTSWHEDEHEEVGTPSVTVIPAQVIHTSTSHSPAENLLADIFAPPRLDFSLKPGWVLNADDYPMPH